MDIRDNNVPDKPKSEEIPGPSGQKEYDKRIEAIEDIYLYHLYQ